MRRSVRQGLLGAVVVVLLGVVVAGLLTGGPKPDRAAALEARLRCPTCKTVSIAESPSETAASMRRIVAEQVAAGRSDEEIIAYFTNRYGAWVLLDPPRRGSTLLLWLLPPAAAVAVIVVVLARRRRFADGARDLSDDQRARVRSAVEAYHRDTAEDEQP